MQNNSIPSPTNPQKRNILSDILKLVIFLGIGIFFIYWFLLKLDTQQKQAIWQSFSGANYFWVAVAMIVCLLSHLLRAMRWQLLFAPMGYKPNLNNTFGSVVVAYMANLAFPRLGEVMRCATLRTSNNIPIEKSLGTVVTERLIDVVAFGMIVVIGLLAMFGQAKDWIYNTLSVKFESLPSVTMIASFSLGLLLAGFLIYKLCYKALLRFKLVQKIDQMIRGGIDGLRSIFHMGRRNTLLFVLYSIGIYFLYIAGGLIIFKAFDETSSLGLSAAFVLYLFGSLGMMISQGGLGAYPVLVWQALAIYGISEATGLAAGWLLWSSQQAIVIAVGMIYLIYFSIRKKKNTEL